MWQRNSLYKFSVWKDSRASIRFHLLVMHVTLITFIPYTHISTAGVLHRLAISTLIQQACTNMQRQPHDSIRTWCTKRDYLHSMPNKCRDIALWVDYGMQCDIVVPEIIIKMFITVSKSALIKSRWLAQLLKSSQSNYLSADVSVEVLTDFFFSGIS